MAGEGKFFVIRSEMNDMVLDIEGGSAYEGAKVQMWTYNGGDNQTFFQDHADKVIRCKQDPELCIQYCGDHLECQRHQQGEYEQQFLVRGDRVCRADNHDQVFDIAANDSSEGARVCVWDSHGGDNQRFRTDHSYPRLFIIRSRMNGKVLDCEGASGDPGTKVIMYGHSGDENQQWYEDRHGIIHSKLSDMVLDYSNGEHIVVNPQQHGVEDQEWVVSGHKIVKSRDPGQVLDIAGENDDDGAHLCAWEYKGGANQEWEFEYLN